MKSEIFQPEGPCDKVLPVNPAAYRIAFYRIQVFDKTLDQIAYAAQMKTAVLNSKGATDRKRVVRLALPIPTLFPALREKYGEVRLSASGEQPIKVSLEGAYLPFDAKRTETAEPEVKLVSEGELATDKPLRLGAAAVTLSPAEKRLLLKRGTLLYPLDGKAVRIAIDTASRVTPLVVTLDPRNGTDIELLSGNASLSTGKLSRLERGLSVTATVGGRQVRLMLRPSGSARASSSSSYLIDDIRDYEPLNNYPSGLADDVFCEVVGALLADWRSGQRDRGRPSPFVHFDDIDSDIFFRIYETFVRDYRWPRCAAMAGLQPPHNRPPLPRYEIGLFTTFEQSWDLQGYSRGALVNSITLAPQEELTLEVFTWIKQKTEEERTVSSEMERNLETSSLNRVAVSIARDLSETTDSGADIGLGIPLPIEGVPVNLDANASVSGQVKTNIQSTINQINEATARSSERVKSTQQVKVVETSESGREDRTTRKIRNPNASRTLTLNCFEVLENYKVRTLLVDTRRFCVLVENPDLGPIDPGFVLAYEDRLQRALLSRNYLPGFEAAKKMVAQGWFDRAALIKAEIEQAANQSIGAQPSPETPQKPVVTVARNLQKVIDQFLQADLLKAAKTLAEYYNPLDGIDITEVQRAAAEDTLGLFNFWLKFKTVTPGIESKARAYSSALADTSSEAAIVQALSQFVAGLDDEWVTSLKMIAASIVAANLSSLLIVPFPVLAVVILELAFIENNAGLPSLIGKAKQELRAYEASSVALPETGGEASLPPAKDPPPQLFSLQELAMIHAEFEKLKLHLEANKIYYTNQIWKLEDANARYERLRLKGLHLHVENRVLGFVGSRAILPLRLSALEPAAAAALVQQIASYDPHGTDRIDGTDYPPIDDTHAKDVSLPTPALYMESAVGRCEALEPYLLDRRRIETQLAQAQADLATARVTQIKGETSKLGGRASDSGAE
jgi:hypothetical protein